MEKVPITFEFKGKTYSGHLSSGLGAGSNSHFHLMVEGYYWGQLFYTKGGWVFGSNAYPEMKELFSDYFGDVVTAWYQ